MTRTDQYMQEAADRMMICDLLSRYVWAADYGTPEEWADQFTEDGVFEGGGTPMKVRGRARLIEFLTELQREVPNLHHVTTSPLVELDGDRATGRAQLNEFMSLPNEVFPAAQGWYEDAYVFDGARWLISKRVCYLPNALGQASGPVLPFYSGFWEVCARYRDD